MPGSGLPIHTREARNARPGMMMADAHLGCRAGVPQDMAWVLLNLFGNGFHAASKRTRDGAEAGFEHAVKVTPAHVATWSRSACATTTGPHRWRPT